MAEIDHKINSQSVRASTEDFEQRQMRLETKLPYSDDAGEACGIRHERRLVTIQSVTMAETDSRARPPLGRDLPIRHIR